MLDREYRNYCRPCITTSTWIKQCLFTIIIVKFHTIVHRPQFLIWPFKKMETKNVSAEFISSRTEMNSLIKSLHMHHKEEDWIMSLKSLEVQRNISHFDSLLILKSMIPSITSTQALRNIVLLFLRKVSVVLEELNVSKSEKLARQTLSTVKDFWSLFSNQHVVITQKTYGRYSPIFYEVLPSLASVYVDLFITVHSTKSTIDKASKRLYSWLTFELNEQCIKSSLLEVCECTKTGAKLVLPLLRSVLSKHPDNTSNLDYLLHFILLKRWSFVCVELKDLLQESSAIRAPRHFLTWLTQNWLQAVEHLPSDKSLKGRRVSEFLLELDQKAVEELIDVFSHCLWSGEQAVEKISEETAEVKETEKQVVGPELFIIDKKGNDKREVQGTEEMLPSKKRKLTEYKKDMHLADDSDADFERIKNYEKDLHLTDDDDDFGEYQRINKSHLDDSNFTENGDYTKEKSVAENCKQDKLVEMYDDESADELSEEIEPQDMEVDGSVSWGNIQNKTEASIISDDEIETSRNLAELGSSRKEARSKNGDKPAKLSDDLLNQSYVVPSSSEEEDLIELSSSPASSSDEGFSMTKIKQKSPQLNICDVDLTTESSTQYGKKVTNKRRSGEIQKSPESENIEIVTDDDSIASSKFENLNTSEFQVGLVISEIRKSLSGKKKQDGKTENSSNVKTRLRSKSESLSQAVDQQRKDLSKQRNTPTNKSVANKSLWDWIRSPSKLLKKQSPAQNVVMDKKEEHVLASSKDSDEDLTFYPQRPKLKEQTIKHSPAQVVQSATSRSNKELSPSDIFGKPLKTYSKRDQKLSSTSKIISNSSDETTPKKDKKSPTRNRASNSSRESTPRKASEEHHQNRYFLRTNCSHRLLNADDICPTCSPSHEKGKHTPEKKNKPRVL
uniref:Uncharacterized protein n=1 Tax=Arion vulgaris TaxID=1028688 RepID=A0A0B7ADE6_9EUPU